MNKMEFPGLIHLCHNGNIWASKGDRIFQSRDSGQSWHRIGNLPISRTDWIKSRTRLTRRLFRLTIYHMQIIKNRYLSVLGFKHFYVFDLENDFNLVAQGPLMGKRPLAYCKTRDERLLYGEYRGNPERSPVSIWESSDGGCSWNSAFTFQDVRHIHGVFQDSYEDNIWITTGDDNHESAIWCATYDFSRVEKIVEGSQQARAITLQFSKERIFFGTDTPLELNYLYSFSRKNPKPERLAEVDGSIFHSCRVGDKMFFSTACEPSPVNTSNYCTVYQLNEQGECLKLSSWKKDFWHMKLFQYGQIAFALGQENGDGLWLSPLGTNQDQHSQYLTIQKEC